MQTTTTYRCIYMALFLLMGTYSHSVLALDCLSNPATGTGNWNDPATWTTCDGTYPQSGDTATVRNAHTVNVNVPSAVFSVTIDAPTGNATTLLNVATGQSLTVGGALAINGGTGLRRAEARISGSGILTVGGNLTPSGATALVTFTGAGALTIGGNFANGATYTPGTGTVTYNGSGGQNVGTYNYYNLTINKSVGTATTSGNITLGNNLTVTSGTLDLVSNTANRGGSAGGGALALASGTLLRLSSGNFPGNYGNVAINAASTVEYYGSANLTVPHKLYGHLLLSGSANRTLPNTALTVAGNFTTTGTVAAVANAGLTINGAMNLGSGTSFDARTFSHTVKGNFSNNGAFTRGTSTFTFDGTVAQAIGGAATAFHTLVISNTAGVTTSVNLSISGNLTNTNGFNVGTTTTTFNGTAVQSLSGATTFHNLTMNNTAGLNTAGLTLIDSNVTVSDTLTFVNGKITTGTTTSPEPYPYKLITTSVCGDTNKVVGAGQTTGWVVGNLQRAVPAVPADSSVTCTFQVGGTANYSPIVVVFPAGTTAGTITGAAMPYTTAPSGHPEITASDINPARNVNRFWTLKDSTVGFTSYSATFHFNAADIDSGADPLEFVIRRYSPPWPSTMINPPSNPPSTWSNVTANEAALTSTSSQGTGITGTGDFAIGNSTISAFLREREWVYQRELYYQ